MHSGENLPVLDENGDRKCTADIDGEENVGVCISEDGKENGKLVGIITEGI